ncbi:molybdopterin-dependent oxidoreductase [Desulfovibrio sulfodismutans]|uniref:Molybdopterin-dependent oxidoreductase n=1 Tax=Desulfolutivibrio sulfodismutans TaxID=63561 RepID=A0A7K3NRT4_9BACT|nr:molybdopterin-dependent oxidoreductase [Desulfolutivibrio sulfodismutans]NDY58543.1 molybdopterin-dependent oxidoreductase [Desulfolutivibrio sulfodismutans]QLA13914.1 molybdopterin-dependent oxidoreductase [Desulfolutivibrio sulfodismutans DSM 3696]
MHRNEWIPTVCYQCKAECAILARVEDGVVKEVKGNPLARGKMCVKGMAGVTTLYSAERLKYPLKRVGERGEGRFERITWDEALDIMEKKLRELRERGEAHTFTYSMFPHSTTDPKWRFVNAAGGFISTGLPHCDSAKIMAHLHTFGCFPNHHIAPMYYTVPKGGLMILSGRHPFGCLDDACVPRDILNAKARGAKLVVIDPIFRSEAAKADWWIPIKPGGDAALFLGVCHYLLTNDLYDKAFCEKWVRPGDMDNLMAFIADKTPEKMSRICEVPAADIVRLAKMCAEAKSVCIDAFKSIMYGNAMDWGHVWSILLVITGNLDNPGGQPLPEIAPMAPVTPVPPAPNLKELGYHRTGPDKNRFDHYNFILEPTWYAAQAVKDGTLKVFFASECNPALSEMGSGEWRKAMTMRDEKGDYKLELFVVTEIMPSETMKWADLVLPDQTNFERWELLYMPWWYNYGHTAALCRPVIEPLHETRHANRVMIELGKRMFPEYFAFKDDLEYYDIELSGVGMSVEKLMDGGGLWSPGTAGFRKYEDAGKFNTASGKIELEWRMYADIGQQWPSPELPLEFRRGEKEFPFILVNFRTIFLNNTGAWSQNNAQLRDPVSGLDANPVVINPIDAKRLGIAEGDMVTVASSTGEVRLPVALSQRIKPGCAGLIHGFGQTMGKVAARGNWAGDNELIADAGSHLDEQDLRGGEAHVATRVNIHK